MDGWIYGITELWMFGYWEFGDSRIYECLDIGITQGTETCGKVRKLVALRVDFVHLIVKLSINIVSLQSYSGML